MTVVILVIFLRGALEIIKDQQRKMNVLIANYKSDLEMTLLHSHNFQEFIASIEKQMNEHEEDVIVPPSNHTYR